MLVVIFTLKRLQQERLEDPRSKALLPLPAPRWGKKLGMIVSLIYDFFAFLTWIMER